MNLISNADYLIKKNLKLFVCLFILNKFFFKKNKDIMKKYHLDRYVVCKPLNDNFNFCIEVDKDDSMNVIVSSSKICYVLNTDLNSNDFIFNMNEELINIIVEKKFIINSFFYFNRLVQQNNMAEIINRFFSDIVVKCNKNKIELIRRLINKGNFNPIGIDEFNIVLNKDENIMFRIQFEDKCYEKNIDEINEDWISTFPLELQKKTFDYFERKSLIDFYDNFKKFFCD